MADPIYEVERYYCFFTNDKKCEVMIVNSITYEKYLREQISLCKEKLDELICVEPISSETVLRLSQKVDVLIAQYYNAKSELIVS
jgi:hypothetical protein